MNTQFTDSHTHLYLDAFDADRDEMIRRAIGKGVTRMFLPNIDSGTIEALFGLADRYPGQCIPMMGLHPTSVKQDFMQELSRVSEELERPGIAAIGETGMDLYRDKRFVVQQEEAFRTQIRWAMERKLPLVIHSRDSFREIFSVLDQEKNTALKGVFHSFTGGKEELDKALGYGFMIGINGIVTFKNSRLDEVVREIPLDKLLLETDAPFLAPVPYRGKRNESSYLVEIAVRIAEIHGMPPEEIAGITSRNASSLFHSAEPHGQP